MTCFHIETSSDTSSLVGPAFGEPPGTHPAGQVQS